jgi:FHA domain
MARLLFRTEGFGNQVLELRMGVNRVGRDPDCELQIDHSTVSTLHCELALTNDGVYLHDCDSTNGTFLNGEPVKEAWLIAGQELRFGDVELFVESTDANIAIPQYERAEPPKPVVAQPDGSFVCPRHLEAQATFRCTHCKEIMCNACIHVMKVKGGTPLYLCCLCSHKCERLEVLQPKKKKSFLGMLQDTVRLKFKAPSGRNKN